VPNRTDLIGDGLGGRKWKTTLGKMNTGKEKDTHSVEKDLGSHFHKQKNPKKKHREHRKTVEKRKVVPSMKKRNDKPTEGRGKTRQPIKKVK